MTDPKELYAKHIQPIVEQRLYLAAFRVRLRSIPVESGWLQEPSARAGAAAALTVLAGFATELDAPAMFDARWLDPAFRTKGLHNSAGFEALSIALAAAAANRTTTPEFTKALMRITFGADPVSTLFRLAMMGDPIPPELGAPSQFEGDPFGGPPGDPFDGLPGGPLNGPLPDPFGDVQPAPIDDLDKLGCAIGLADALTGVQLAVAAGPRVTPYAPDSITALDPARACPGSIVWIRGRGFGASRPANVHVYFGGVDARVEPGSWTDTAIAVVVPGGITTCCVSLVQIDPAIGAGGALGPALSQLADILVTCFGPSAAGAAQHLNQVSGAVDHGQATCQANGANRFAGGPPAISSFTANGRASALALKPRQELKLAWIVDNADRLEISAIRLTPQTTNPDTGPVIPAPMSGFAADPVRGSVTLSASDGILPWQARYTLRANNSCGTAEMALDVAYAASVGLVCVGGGMRSSFDVGALDYLGKALPVTPTIFAGSGFGALSAASAAANFINPTQLVTFWSGISNSESLYAASGLASLFGLHDPTSYFTVYDNSRAFADTIALGPASRDRLSVNATPPDAGGVFVSDVADKAFDAASDKLLDKAEEFLEDQVTNDALNLFLDEVPVIAIIAFFVRFGVQIGISLAQSDLVRKAMATTSAVNPSPLLMSITAAYAGILPTIRTNGAKLRVPLAGLESAETFYADENGSVFELPSRSAIAVGVGLETILAAAVALPGWVPTVKLGPQNFVDGSVLDPAPIGAAIDAGADHIIILQPNKRTLRASDSLDGASFLLVAARAAQMRQSLAANAAVATFDGWSKDIDGRAVGEWRAPITLIESSLSLAGLDAAEGDNGLIAIWSEYGYMRAFDVLAPQVAFPDEVIARNDVLRFARSQFQEALRSTSDSITVLRYECWYVEHFLAGVRIPFAPRPQSGQLVPVSDPSQAAELRTLKLRVRDATVDRLRLVQSSVRNAIFPRPEAVRRTASAWYLSFEKHPWPFPFYAVPENPWAAMSGFGNGGTVALATMPAPLDSSLFEPL